MNFDGLIIESHCDPASALSDSEQQITPASLSDILSGLRLNSGNTAEDSLRVFREEIDAIDDELVALLARRWSWEGTVRPSYGPPRKRRFPTWPFCRIYEGYSRFHS